MAGACESLVVAGRATYRRPMDETTSEPEEVGDDRPSCVWVDADALPGAVRELLVRASVRREVRVVFVANQWMPRPNSAWVEIVTVSAGADVADDYIVEQCAEGDLVVTFDIPFAARAVERGATVVTPRGNVLDERNVTEALSFRDFSQELRDVGIQTGGPAAFSDRDKQLFANALDRWLTRR